ncbi:helix-turn-helix domain-containing protein [Brachybacterium sp. P6-10-X1]|uniref:helix-turn-helix domain-containing protein n=1 Tax=Brachybacterium sp. P6-10-X1 TaxID=1903186 RepID=UPI0009F83FDD|nr:helix-turn-helix domain-containing protein [Brachybacterium sp. P6-10-X1]
MTGHLEPLLRELVGAVLRDERRRQGRTLARVAQAAGISMQHLSDVERGRKDPSSELLAAITGALGVTVPQLLLRAADDAPSPTEAAGAAERPAVLELTSVGGARGGRRPSGDEVSLAARDLAGTDRPGLTLLSAA